MLLLLALLACRPEPSPAPPGTPSAALASRAGEVARRAAALAVKAEQMEAMFDAVRAAPPEERAELQAEIRRHAAELQADARAIREEVGVIEAGAEVY